MANTKKLLQSDWLGIVQYWPDTELPDNRYFDS